MTSRSCRLCGSLKTKKNTSMKDQLIRNFVRLSKVTLTLDPDLPSTYCEKCESDLRRVNGFIQRVLEQQISFDKTRAVQPSKANDVMRKLKANKTPAVKFGNVTIKRVLSENTKGNDTMDPLLVMVKSEPTFLPAVCIKEPAIEFPSNMSQYDESSKDSFYNEGSDESDQDDDEDYVVSRPKKKPATTPRKSFSPRTMPITVPKTVENLAFTCATCKKSYNDFELLTKHITARSCSTATNVVMSCKICRKKFSSEKGLLIHMKSHISAKQRTVNT